MYAFKCKCICVYVCVCAHKHACASVCVSWVKIGMCWFVVEVLSDKMGSDKNSSTYWLSVSLLKQTNIFYSVHSSSSLVSREEVKKANTEPSKVQPASAKTYLFRHSNVLNCKMANRQDNQVMIGGCPLVCYTEENLNHNLSTSIEQLSYSPVDWRLSVNWSTTQSSRKLLFSPHYSLWRVYWRIFWLLITPVTEKVKHKTEGEVLLRQLPTISSCSLRLPIRAM